MVRLVVAAEDESASLRIPEGKETPVRRQSTITRIVRSTVVGERVKRLHDFTCNGPDVLENILCLCPNCHVLLDVILRRFPVHIYSIFAAKPLENCFGSSLFSVGNRVRRVQPA